MKRIVVKFRDVEGVINHRQQYRTFWSPIFGSKYSMDKESAINELDEIIRKAGFTRKELVAMNIVKVKLPSEVAEYLGNPSIRKSTDKKVVD